MQRKTIAKAFCTRHKGYNTSPTAVALTGPAWYRRPQQYQVGSTKTDRASSHSVTVRTRANASSVVCRRTAFVAIQTGTTNGSLQRQRLSR